MTASSGAPGPSAGLADLLAGVATALAGHRDVLNRLDGVAGDGDLGVTVSQAAEAIIAIVPEIRDLPVADAIRTVGSELARKAPSTSGTLVAFAFLAAGRVGEIDADASGARAIPYLEAPRRRLLREGR